MTVQTAVSATSSHRLSGAPNFRDIGGVATAEGRHVLRDRLFRSEGLSRLSDDDLQVLSGLGVQLVCDLRSEAERTQRPTRWPKDLRTEWLLLDILIDLRAGNQHLREVFEQDLTAAGAARVMTETYRLLPTAIAPGLGRLLHKLADGTAPVLIHCTAGKDRTGFVCASLLRVLGVSRDAIYADYLLSGALIDRTAMLAHTGEMLRTMFGTVVEPAALDALIGVSSSYLDASFATIDAQYGSFENYMEKAVGMDAALLHRLKGRLLA